MKSKKKKNALCQGHLRFSIEVTFSFFHILFFLNHSNLLQLTQNLYTVCVICIYIYIYFVFSSFQHHINKLALEVMSTIVVQLK